MTESETQKPPSWRPLDERQRRVLGVLIEKAKTTPAGYPMTVNAVTIGCNQKSNRDPVMDLEEFYVEKTLDELRNMGAVSEVDWMGRVAKYRHHAFEWLGVNRAELAVLAELLLRGEQTIGDLRARAARMEPIPDLATLKPLIEGLVQRGLMIELTPPGRGQVVTHNLYLEPELAELRTRSGGRAAPPHVGDVPVSRPSSATPSPNAVAELSAAVDELRAEVQRLRTQVEDLERSIEGGSGGPDSR